MKAFVEWLCRVFNIKTEYEINATRELEDMTNRYFDLMNRFESVHGETIESMQNEVKRMEESCRNVIVYHDKVATLLNTQMDKGKDILPDIFEMCVLGGTIIRYYNPKDKYGVVGKTKLTKLMNRKITEATTIESRYKIISDNLSKLGIYSRIGEYLARNGNIMFNLVSDPVAEGDLPEYSIIYSIDSKPYDAPFTVDITGLPDTDFDEGI